MAARFARLSLARALGALLLTAGLVVSLLSAVAGAQGSGPAVDVLEISGPLDRTVVGYLERAIAKAEAEGVEVVVVQLDTPGALGVEVSQLVDPVRDSEVPVAVWVGPPGARAVGAGLSLARAADVVGMAPATVLGPAEPTRLDVTWEGSAEGEAGRVVVATGDRTLSPDDLPEDALPPAADPEQVLALDDGALIDRGVADFVAASLDDVLRELDGRVVMVADGSGGTVERTLDVDPVTTSVRFNNMGLAGRVLHTVADPTLAYLLLIGGALAMLFELYQPGFGVAGISGLAMVGLAVYGLVVLPTQWWSVGLVVLGLLLLAADLAIAGLGALTAGGALALGLGSAWLFDGVPWLRVPLWLVVASVLFNLLFFVVIMTTVLRAQGVQAMAGAERVIGKPGVVRSMLNPEGHVFVDGALWRARAPEGAGKVRTGTPVRVVGTSDGLTLDVELLPSERSTPVA